MSYSTVSLALFGRKRRRRKDKGKKKKADIPQVLMFRTLLERL